MNAVKRRRVSVVGRLDTLFHARMTRGVMRYAERREGWELSLVHVREQETPRVPSADGVITTFLPSPRGRPTVLMWPNAPTRSKAPRVEPDDGVIGRLAAEHLAGRRLERLATIGYAGSAWSRRRQRAFAVSAPAPVNRLDVPADPQASRKVRRLISSWLATQSFPLAVFAVNDTLGLEVMHAAEALGVHVPEQLAVLGVDNVEVMCRSCRPALSSVDQPLERIGYLAARRMDDRLRGRRVPAVTRVAPSGIHTRGSTQVYGHQDELVARAATFVARSMHEGIGVEQVCRAVGVSRPTLSRRLRRAVGMTALQMLHWQQAERASELLRVTDLSHAAIAEHCGFKHASHFSQFFRDRVGLPPSIYRRRHRDLSL